MANQRPSASSAFSLVSCLSSPPELDQQLSQSQVPVIALVNGLSGGHKGEKVQRILKQRQIPAYDLLLLSTNTDYFDAFIQQFSQIWDKIIQDELVRIKHKTDKNWSLHPRILIGGGDGSIAWALSILDQALLTDTMINQFWNRSQLIDSMTHNSDIDLEEITDTKPTKRRLSVRTNISQDFYYSAFDSNSATFDKDIPFDPLTPMTNPTSIKDVTHRHHDKSKGKSFDFVSAQLTNCSSSTNLAVTVENNEEEKSDLPSIDNISLGPLTEEIPDSEAIDYESSASESAQDEEQMIEDFMNQSLSNIMSPHKHDISPQKTEETKSNQAEHKNDNDDLSASIVTREELLSVRTLKQNAAISNHRTSHDELRILQGIYDCRISPCIALVPLGTGNDLSRCLGTGFTYPGSNELVNNLVDEYKIAPMTKLDRWKIQFLENDGGLKERQVSEMLCYFSLGFEGQIAHRFAQARSKNPKLFDRTWKNKIQYVLAGIGAGVEEAFNITKPLNKMIDVYVDGVKLKLPSKTRSLVVSNIQSMADGVYFWGKGPDTKKDMKQYTEPGLGDGKLEVMAAKGIYKYLQMRVGISHYRRLAQPKTVTIITKQELPIQVDGESWIESPGIVQIFLKHQVFAVVGKNEPRGVRII